MHEDVQRDEGKHNRQEKHRAHAFGLDPGPDEASHEEIEADRVEEKENVSARVGRAEIVDRLQRAIELEHPSKLEQQQVP